MSWKLTSTEKRAHEYTGCLYVYIHTEALLIIVKLLSLPALAAMYFHFAFK